MAENAHVEEEAAARATGKGTDDDDLFGAFEEQEPVGPGPFTVDLGVTRVELAARLGTVPETLSRAFHALQDEGIIESHGQRVHVLDREGLIARSNGVL